MNKESETSAGRQKVIERIRQLEDTTGRSGAEAEAFVAKAAALAMQHQISRNEINVSTRAVRRLGRTDLRYFMGRASRGVLYLYDRVAPVFGCAVLGNVADAPNPDVETPWGSPKWQRRAFVVLLGTEEDRELVQALVDSVLLPQMMRDVAADRPRSRMSYTVAWADSIGDRLRAQRKKVYTEAGAVVFVDAELEAMVRQLTGGKSGRVAFDRNSASVGGNAGRRADLGGAKVDPGRGRQVLGAGR